MAGAPKERPGKKSSKRSGKKILLMTVILQQFDQKENRDYLPESTINIAGGGTHSTCFSGPYCLTFE
jgi:hypothetical protein